MKRVNRRMVGIVIGLCLGWYVAGLTNIIPPIAQTMAEDKAPAPAPAPEVHTPEPGEPETGTAPKAVTPTSTEKKKHDHAKHDHSKHEHAEHPSPAEKLVTYEMGEPTPPWWYPSILLLVLVFFGAAIFLGYPALKLRGPEPADPADDHGHDDHHAEDKH